MKDTGLIQILRTFSKPELKQFDKFLRSPYFTEGKSISSQILYKYFVLLKKQYPEFKEEKVSGKTIYNKLYHEKEYNDIIMRKLNSEMLRLIEKFFSYLEFENNETEFRHNLLVQLGERKVEKVYLKKFNEMLKYLSELKRDEDYFYETYRTWFNYFDFYYLSKHAYKLEETLKNTNNFFIYVVLGSLRIYLWAISFENLIHKKNKLYLFDEILEHIKNNYVRYKEIPQIVLYYNLILLVTSKDEQYFSELKSLKKKSFSILSEIDKYNYFMMMSNSCNFMIQEGNLKFREERFLLDRQFLSLELKGVPKGIHFIHFLEIARNAIRLGKLKWTELLSKKLYTRIDPQYRDFALNYTKALIEFEHRNYDDSIELLSKLRVELSRQKQYIRNLLIQIYFEKNEYDTVLSLIDTSKHFLRREKKLGNTARENFHNFITSTEKLILANEKSRFAQVRKLQQNLKTFVNVENKDWLLNKAKELLDK